MLRKLAAVLILILSVTLVSGCSKDKETAGNQPVKTVHEVPAGPGPTSTDPKATAEKVLGFIEAKDWKNLYDYIYVDIQRTISRDEFIKFNSQAKVSYKGHVVEEPVMVSEWVNKIDGVSYKNVAEIAYTVDVVTPRGNINMKNKMYLTQTPEKNWRYIWIKK